MATSTRCPAGFLTILASATAEMEEAASLEERRLLQVFVLPILGPVSVTLFTLLGAGVWLDTSPRYAPSSAVGSTGI